MKVTKIPEAPTVARAAVRLTSSFGHLGIQQPVHLDPSLQHDADDEREDEDNDGDDGDDKPPC